MPIHTRTRVHPPTHTAFAQAKLEEELQAADVAEQLNSTRARVAAVAEELDSVVVRLAQVAGQQDRVEEVSKAMAETRDALDEWKEKNAKLQVCACNVCALRCVL